MAVSELRKHIFKATGKQINEAEAKDIQNNPKALRAALEIKSKKRKKKDRKDFKGQKESPNPMMLKNIADDIRKIRDIK